MNKPAMVAAALALGVCAFGNRASAQAYDKTVESPPDLQMRRMVPEMLSPEDTTFLMVATGANNAEIEMSQMALTRSSNSATRDFAQRILSDCESRGDALTRLSNRWNVFTPLGAGKYDRWVSNLEKVSDSDFDRQYNDYIHRLNLTNLDLYHRRSWLTNVGDIQIYANKYLPTIRNDNKTWDSMNTNGSMHR